MEEVQEEIKEMKAKVFVSYSRKDSKAARNLISAFEKMGYDQSQLARAYLHAWQVTGTVRYDADIQ